MSISNSNSVGTVYTPALWARWLLERWDIFSAWVDGATVCDPTAGQGIFLLELLGMARQRGIPLTKDLVGRLGAYDVDTKALASLKRNISAKYGIGMNDVQIHAQDIILSPPKQRFDILVGNPPWANFTDLMQTYKEQLKPHFIAEGLVPDKKKALLGSSRVDIAALVLKIALGTMLNTHGKGYFFLPVSLFCGDDAHTGFRDFMSRGRKFAVKEVCEFSKTKIFSGISTAYCCSSFSMDEEHSFPVRYYREGDVTWKKYNAYPLQNTNDPWLITDRAMPVTSLPPHIALGKEQMPRQGVNTCGANNIFIFPQKPEFLPQEFVFPFATKDTFSDRPETPQKWVFIPHDRMSGKPLSLHIIKKFPSMYKYLLEFEDILSRRKGTLIQSMIKKGFWWALFGVGAYSFTPYKVIWQAYGKKDFIPRIVGSIHGQPWQANQSMQAYIPCNSMNEATPILHSLQHTAFQKLLRQLNGEGKCNWAQPGKIKKIMNLGQQNSAQISLF